MIGKQLMQKERRLQSPSLQQLLAIFTNITLCIDILTLVCAILHQSDRDSKANSNPGAKQFIKEV